MSALRSLNFPGKDPLGQVAIHLVQTFVDIFEKQDRIGRIDLPVGTDQGGQGDEIAPFRIPAAEPGL